MTTTNHVPTIKRWESNPDRESLKMIYRFLSGRRSIEKASLEPCKTHPRLVRATVSDQASSIASGYLKIHWYETDDFVITYEIDGASDESTLLRWLYYPDTNVVKMSNFDLDDVKKLTTLSNYPKQDYHPLQVMYLVLATIIKHEE